MTQATAREHIRRWYKSSTAEGKVTLWLIASVTFMLIVAAIVSWVQEETFNHLSPAEHLARARAVCGTKSNCIDPFDAKRHLGVIQVGAAEHAEAVMMLESIAGQQAKERDEEAKAHDLELSRSREQMERNYRGISHDPFECGTSTEGKPTVSFDSGRFWWLDDGRCAPREQEERDSDAKLRSYWSSTVRVDTDMDSSWLPDEERTCRTYPDASGRVARVSCEDGGSYGDHNIPVEFWGGVERNTISDWKCRRVKNLLDDKFVCKAID